MKYITNVVVVLLLATSCDKPNPGFDAGGPISRYLLGRWNLEKIVTSSRTKSGAQIGYTEVFVSGNDGNGNLDKIYRNDTLVATHIWTRNETSSAANMTVLVNYFDGSQRFFKITLGSNQTTLETSGYLPKVGTAQDSVKYYYRSMN